MFQHTAARRRLPRSCASGWGVVGFNTQPPEGGCAANAPGFKAGIVSTHSRPKAAAWWGGLAPAPLPTGFNTQPPEGGCMPGDSVMFVDARFQHTAARRRLPGRVRWYCRSRQFQHTAARRRLPAVLLAFGGAALFQHTAARRRLPPGLRPGATLYGVSTHSRPKAAA